MMTDQMPPISDIAKLQESVLEQAAAFEKMGRIARRNTWINTGLMVAWILATIGLCSTVFWSVFFFSVAAAHGIAAAVWEEVDPRTWARREAREQQHVAQLRAEVRSHYVIDRMRQDELDRMHPWRRWAGASIAHAVPMVGLYLAMRRKIAIPSGVTATPPLGSLGGFTIKNG